MSGSSRYVLDSDSFIRAKREHYVFDICPGYWDALLRPHEQNRLGSIEPVRHELLRGKDALADWVKEETPRSFFESIKDTDVQTAYAAVIQWIQDSENFNTAAKDKFAKDADPWLIAFAHAKKRHLVTYEVSQPESKSKIKIPDVARQFNVRCVPPYVMLRQLKARLQLE